MTLHLGCGGIGVVQHAAVRAYQRHAQAVLPQHGLFAGQHSAFGGQQVRAGGKVLHHLCTEYLVTDARGKHQGKAHGQRRHQKKPAVQLAPHGVCSFSKL